MRGHHEGPVHGRIVSRAIRPGSYRFLWKEKGGDGIEHDIFGADYRELHRDGFISTRTHFFDVSEEETKH